MEQWGFDGEEERICASTENMKKNKKNELIYKHTKIQRIRERLRARKMWARDLAVVGFGLAGWEMSVKMGGKEFFFFKSN